MASALQADEAAHEETRVMENNAQEKRNSLQHHFAKSSKEMELTPRRSRSMKMREEKTLETTKLNASIGSDQHALSVSSVSSMPSGCYQKPWLSRKAVRAEELIKHMSKVPSYLQHIRRGDNIQAKALNFGVLDWGLLEKWISHTKRVANGRGENSSCSGNGSSSFSAFGSSIHSHLSTGIPIPGRKQTASRDSHQNPSVLGSLTQLMEKRSPKDVMDFQDSRTSAIKFSTGHDQHLDADCGPTANCSSFGHSKDKRQNSGSKATSHNVSIPPDSSTSCSTSKCDDALAFIHKAVEAADGRSKKTEQKQYLTLLQNKECMWDHLRHSIRVRHSSFDCLISNDGMPAERYRSSFSGSFPEDVQTTHESPHVPSSCPLLCSISTNEPDSGSNILQENKVSIIEPEGRNGKHGQFTSSSSEQLVNTINKSGRGEVKAIAATGRKLPHHLSVAGPTLMGSSSWEGSSVRQSKSMACPDKSDGDKAAANNRGRYSPLRRILDPILKPKHHIYSSVPIAASPVRNSHELNTDKSMMRADLASTQGPCNSSDTGINFTWQSRENLNLSSQMPNSSRGSLLDEGQLASTRHSLLQLAWKNGLPLFMFSSSDGDILAATVSKKSVSKKDTCECIYTIFSVHEVKKKSGVWINPGSKSKKHGLLSHVLGQLKVSSSMLAGHDSRGHSVLRELVLFGAEMAPTCHESTGSLFSSELAAIITVDPQEMPEGSSVHSIHRGNGKHSSLTNSAEQICYFRPEKGLQVDKNNENSSLSTFIAILPSGIHGLPDKGGPSPLIQRWKSGGACDCGGWDEGCMLTILTNNQEKRSLCLVHASCSTDGTHQFELFVKGGSPESKHAFRMVSSKEGLHAVDFRSSIASLQAFAICIAILHSRNSTIRAMEAESLQEHIFSENVGKAPANYVPNRPPLSPVGRA
ncbi:uncharacterized protein [Elaeis guineensis]|uniref:Uncharacterized protein LOC105052155 n=1 Tax=Elaeis guineensis var. tenera TaxID=51953 RepID=A0A6J0PN58_ELAGV|nr:uncharacterized protein LOC105052155 [Elaeis guineensis]XP_019708672.1 uncharacterized protein LOC105052155 [Elaeis guineensis]XP_019708673.1 uncharacterized protein LOC105052155 [Elaeis guineensis]